MDSGELGGDELEELEVLERLYAMIHYADDTDPNVEQNNQNHSNTTSAPTATSKSTVRRYWHTGEDQVPVNTQYQKVNPQKSSSTLKHAPPTKNNIVPTTPGKHNNVALITKPKEETPPSPKHNVTSDLALFGSPLAQDTKTTIKIDENDDLPCLDLETSDEDEVIEVSLPPKPTITIESSDEDEISIITPQKVQKTQEQASKVNQGTKRPVESNGRDVSTSPVPSVVSSVSDEFIRGDCIALNISSRRPDNPSFDFSLHGSDLLGTPSKKKKKKKNKESHNTNAAPETTIELPEKTVKQLTGEFFATPKNKAKNKKQKTKTYKVTEKSIPNPDVYDSDSNQSFDISKKPTYMVTDKSLPCADIYESDSSQSEITKIPNKANPQQPECAQPGSSVSSAVMEEKTQEIPTKPSLPSTNLTPDTRSQKDQRNPTINTSVVDLTDDLDDTGVLEDSIEENIIMANVTGFEESDDYGDHDQTPKDPSKLGSTKVPAILYSNINFEEVPQRFSVTKLRAEMKKFYNESWGGENFNHRAIQKTMSRDKNLWEIDPKDRMPSPYRRKVTCNYCNRVGHRDDTCRMKPPICHMCGNTGHNEPRCPHKICVNCGSPNHMYSTICRNCSDWGRIVCAECQQVGHPSSHCPDLWRRYHNTIDNNAPLEQYVGQRKHWQQFCSGCTRRGHLVHTCRLSLPFSGLPINSPYVVRYKPFYPPSQPQQFTGQNDKTLQKYSDPRLNKRQSKSPAAHETHASKKRRESAGDGVENRAAKGMDRQVGNNSQSATASTPHRIKTQSENALQKNAVSSLGDFQNTPKPIPSLLDMTFEKAPDYIAITSANHDKQGQMIQDNEVSDTSDVITSARIYITNEVLTKLKMKEGQDWLKVTSTKHTIQIDDSDAFFLKAKGKLVDIEAFQAELRDWMSPKKEQSESQEVEDPTHLSDNIPKNRNSVIRKLANAFHSLQGNLGDPKHLLKELKYHQRNHYILQNQKIVSPQKLSNSTHHINEMVTKLNMLLLGQARLAEGSTHMHELYSLAQQLSSLRTKKISLDLRKKIGEHYQAVFTAVARTDYPQLLAEYFNTSSSKTIVYKNQKKKKKKPKQPSPTGPFTGIQKAYRGVVNNIRATNNTLYRLTLYHRRLTNAGSKECLELAKRYHGLIALFNKNKMLSPKATKKLMKLQKQADLFLT